MKMEEWVTFILLDKDLLVCAKCLETITYQKVHMYVNVDNEVEEVLCEECWTKEDTLTIKRYSDIDRPYKGLTVVAKILEI